MLAEITQEEMWNDPRIQNALANQDKFTVKHGGVVVAQGGRFRMDEDGCVMDSSDVQPTASRPVGWLNPKFK